MSKSKKIIGRGRVLLKIKYRIKYNYFFCHSETINAFLTTTYSKVFLKNIYIYIQTILTEDPSLTEH